MNQREEREQNKQRVIWNAQALFIKNGIARTTISQIAKESGLSDMSVYRYFGNKANLAAVVWQESLRVFYDDFMRFYKEETRDLTTGYEKFLKCMDLYVRIYRIFPNWYTYTREMFLLANSEDAAEGSFMDRAFWERFYKTIPTPILHALKEGQEDGSVRKDVNIYEIYQLIHNVYTGTGIYNMFDTGVDDIEIYHFTAKVLGDYIKAEDAK